MYKGIRWQIVFIFITLNISANKRCIGAKSLDDFEEKVSFTANVGTVKKDFSHKGRDVPVIAFSCVPN